MIPDGGSRMPQPERPEEGGSRMGLMRWEGLRKRVKLIVAICLFLFLVVNDIQHRTCFKSNVRGATFQLHLNATKGVTGTLGLNSKTITPVIESERTPPHVRKIFVES